MGYPMVCPRQRPCILSMMCTLYESTARSRPDAAGSTGLTPLVGREQEVRLLLERWAQVKDGLGQVVLLALYPLIDLLERVARRFDREESPPHKLSKLEGLLASACTAKTTGRGSMVVQLSARVSVAAVPHARPCIRGLIYSRHAT
jgi:hypothetical protein